jgi:hypothetical protein
MSITTAFVPFPACRAASLDYIPCFPLFPYWMEKAPYLEGYNSQGLYHHACLLYIWT